MNLLIDDAVPYAEAIFSSLGKVTLMPGRAIQNQHLKNIDALIIRSRTQVNAQLLDNTPVKFVGSTVVGLDHIDQDYLAQQGIYFYSAQGCNANSVAEYVITAIFALAEKQHIPLLETQTPPTLGIIGVGHVGQKLQQKAEILGWKTLLNDPPRQQADPVGCQDFVDLKTALQADFISVHTPLTFEGEFATHHLINQQHLSNLLPHQTLINAARGGIIDETAWLKAQTRANMIDCWENEPNIHPQLYSHADIATPHIAGHSLEAKVAGSEMVYQALCQFSQQTPKTEWKSLLPPIPEPIQMLSGQSLQNQVHQALLSAYPIWQDHQALQQPHIEQTWQLFETYRRHYPIRREWSLHTYQSTYPLPLLKALGFQEDIRK
ncbi:4-phosphoerythronate dehydrogenase [Galenea microaerophila]